MMERGSRLRRGCVVLAMIVALVPSGALRSAAADPIQPGDLVVVGGMECTLNFVYDGTGSQRGNVYLGTAAHCVERIGDRASDGRGRTWGSVAFIGTPYNPPTDFAFIRVFPEFESMVRAAVKGHRAAPKGVATAARVSAGDLLQVSGYGMVFRPTALTREQRRGILLSATDRVYHAEVPIFFGDSGAPVVQIRGDRALGLLIGCIGACSLARGPTVEGIIATAGSLGFDVRLRTVGR